MADESGKAGVRRKVVTLASLQAPKTTESLESLASQETLESLEPARDRASDLLLLARYEQIMERLRQETEAASDTVLVTAQDREVSLLQSALAREAARVEALAKDASLTSPLGPGGQEVKFGTGMSGGDWFGWARSLLDWVDRRSAHPIMRPGSATPDTLPNIARVAMAGDWGTGLYGAPKIADRIKALGGFDLLLHLGDVYYSGTEQEIQERFLDLWPFHAGRIHRALNSNHEMYSGGYGYFQLTLPAFKQPASYFALANDHWVLVGLDTAYVDHDIDIAQVAWLNLVVQNAQGRKVVLFSHQQLFSRLDNQGPKLDQALRHLLERQAITAWYWGHEHQCVIYDAHPRYGLLGRCLGNGGIPEARKTDVRKAPTERTEGPVQWKRLSATSDSPSCLALDGPNPDIPGEEEKFVPHSFMTLEFDGPRLRERVILPDGRVVFDNTI